MSTGYADYASALPWREAVTRALESRRAGVLMEVSGDFLRDSIAVETSLDHFADTLLVRLSALVLADQVVSERDEVTVEVPADWWQHLKRDHAARWWMRWLVARHPVRTVTLRNLVSFDQYRMYPGADVVLPKLPYGTHRVREVLAQGGWT